VGDNGTGINKSALSIAGSTEGVLFKSSENVRAQAGLLPNL
jgi:hypothetical protein